MCISWRCAPVLAAMAWRCPIWKIFCPPPCWSPCRASSWVWPISSPFLPSTIWARLRLAILVAGAFWAPMFAGNVPALFFSLMGGVLAMLIMILLHRLPGLSIYGVSVAGAAGHNTGQVAAAVLTLGSTAPVAYLPVLLVVSVFTGALTGFVAAVLFSAMEKAKIAPGS